MLPKPLFVIYCSNIQLLGASLGDWVFCIQLHAVLGVCCVFSGDLFVVKRGTHVPTGAELDAMAFPVDKTMYCHDEAHEHA